MNLISIRWAGSRPAVETALRDLGDPRRTDPVEGPDGPTPPPSDPRVRLWGPVESRTLLGMEVCFCLLLAEQDIPVPEGLELADDALSRAVVGEVMPGPPAEIVEVSRGQARVVMAAHILPDGRSVLTATKAYLEGMLAATAALPEADPRRVAAVQATEWFDGAGTYRRNHPLMQQIPAAIPGLTESDVDALFQQARAVE